MKAPLQVDDRYRSLLHKAARRGYTEWIFTTGALIESMGARAAAWFEARTETDDTWMYITADVVETCNTLFPDEPGYYNLHLSLPNPAWSPGTGHYRALVDLVGHAQLGGKTLRPSPEGNAGHHRHAVARLAVGQDGASYLSMA